MSDGPSDAAMAALIKALAFAEKTYPGLTVLVNPFTPTATPAGEAVVCIYEEWLAHVVEIVKDRTVTIRWLIRPYRREPEEMVLTAENNMPGYYIGRRYKVTERGRM